MKKMTKKIYPEDTMTAEERMQAVIRLQQPDRVPVAPLFYYFVAHYNNISYTELYDRKKYVSGLIRMFDELGPWDGDYRVNVYDPKVFTLLLPMKMLEPGRELPDNIIRQFVEIELMKVEDYDWVIKLGKQIPFLAFIPYMMRLMPRMWDDVREGWKAYPDSLIDVAKTLALWVPEFRKWNDKGVAIVYPVGAEAAFDTFSMTRGIIDFMRDMKNRPEKIVEAADALTDSIVNIIRLYCAISGVNRAVLALHRSSNDFVSPKDFRELSFPGVKDIVERLASHNIDTVLHCDGNWDYNFEILRELPAGRAIVQCDGASDIFKAKEIVGDTCCIMGDVPADMLVLASPTEVDEYCHRLIEEVGKGGGFILSAGCEVPPNSKPENVKAMVQSVAKYGYYK